MFGIHNPINRLAQQFPLVQKISVFPGIRGIFWMILGMKTIPLLPFYLLTPLYGSILFAAIIFLIITKVLFNRFSALAPFFFIAGALVVTTHRLYEKNTYQSLIEHEKDIVFLSGRVQAAGQTGEKGGYFEVRCDSLFLEDGRALTRNIRVSLFSKKPLHAGTYILARGTYTIPMPSLFKGGYDQFIQLRKKNLWVSFFPYQLIATKRPPPFFTRLSVSFRTQVKELLEYVHSEQHRRILKSIFLGEKDISEETATLFRDAGASHLFAISGLHAGVLALAIGVLFRYMPLGTIAKKVILLCILWLYVLFIGFQPSLFRAVFMISIFILAPLIQKKSYSLNSLGVAAIVWLSISPWGISSPGFQLSFTATFGILFAYFRFKEYIRKNILPRPLLYRYLWNSLFISLSAFVFTAPVVLYHFKTISFYGLFYNVLAVPLLTLIMWLFSCCVAVSYIVAPLAEFLLIPTSFFLTLLIESARWQNALEWTRVGVTYLPLIVIALYFMAVMAFSTVSFRQGKNSFIGTVIVLFVLMPAVSILQRFAVLPKMFPHRTTIAKITGSNPAKGAVLFEFSDSHWFLYAKNQKNAGYLISNRLASQERQLKSGLAVFYAPDGRCAFKKFPGLPALMSEDFVESQVLARSRKSFSIQTPDDSAFCITGGAVALGSEREMMVYDSVIVIKDSGGTVQLVVDPPLLVCSKHKNPQSLCDSIPLQARGFVLHYKDRGRGVIQKTVSHNHPLAQYGNLN